MGRRDPDPEKNPKDGSRQPRADRVSICRSLATLEIKRDVFGVFQFTELNA